jgi:hypothetical protein
MRLKVVFNKTAYVKSKISNNFKQNINETDSKQPKIHRKILTSLWIQEKIREPKKSGNFRQIFVISNEKSIG